jgi:hypothetical protein
MTDVRAEFQRASEQFERTVAVDRSSLENQTPSEVSVRELVEQVRAGNEFAVRLLSGAAADGARAGLDGVRLVTDSPLPTGIFTSPWHATHGKRKKTCIPW